MKTIIFIILKLCELALLPIAYAMICFIGQLFFQLIHINNVPKFFSWESSFMGFMICLGLIILYCLIRCLIPTVQLWIEVNKDWADEIYHKFFAKCTHPFDFRIYQNSGFYCKKCKQFISYED